MSFNRTQSRAVTGLLTGHNTLRRHLYLLGLQDIPLCRKCGVMEETSAHILCECEALASLRYPYLDSVFLEPKNIQIISLGATWSFSKASGLPWLDMGHKGPRCTGAVRSRTPDIVTHSLKSIPTCIILEMTSDRKLFTNHGLHLNGLGMEVLSKQIISLTYTILDQKKDHPITLCWNLDLIHTDTLHQGRVINRTSTRTKNTPSTESNDFLW